MKKCVECGINVLKNLCDDCWKELLKKKLEEDK